MRNSRLGPYAYTRNPLYMGSLIMAIGFSIAARSLWVWLVMLVMFVAIHLPVIRSEESYLRHRFSNFDPYAPATASLPRMSAYRNQTGSFSRDLHWQHREYNAILGAAAVLAAPQPNYSGPPHSRLHRTRSGSTGRAASLIPRTLSIRSRSPAPVSVRVDLGRPPAGIH